VGPGGVADLTAGREQLRGTLNPQTFAHSLAVSEEAARRAPVFGADPTAARWAGLLHDCAKGLSPEAYLAEARAEGLTLCDAERASPPLLHQRLGARWARVRYGVDAPAVLGAIRCHTTGAAEMDGLARCLFVVDWTSSDRTYDGVEALRAALEQGASAGFLAVLRAKQQVVRARGLPDHPWALAARERWLLP
jgi:predicted HD superfamily hydrolase involved in NAD metabolism